MSTSIVVENTGSTLSIVTPYNPAFVADLKATFGRDARWDAAAKSWSVPSAGEAKARELVTKHYGTDGSEQAGPTVTVRWTAARDVKAECGPVMRYGRAIVSARGRDSGATPESGVVLESGKVGSGGSARYWKTIVHEGAVLTIHDVPLTLAVEDSEAIVVGAGDEEAAKLQARLAEIDAERAAILSRLAQLGY